MSNPQREAVMLKIGKKLADAEKLAFDNKNLIGNSLFGEQIRALKNRFMAQPSQSKPKAAGRSRAISFTEADFNQKKTSPLKNVVEDEFKDMTVEQVKVMANELGLTIKGKDRETLIDEIKWQRKGKAVVMADESEEE